MVKGVAVVLVQPVNDDDNNDDDDDDEKEKGKKNENEHLATYLSGVSE